MPRVSDKTNRRLVSFGCRKCGREFAVMVHARSDVKDVLQEIGAAHARVNSICAVMYGARFLRMADQQTCTAETPRQGERAA